jgi:hypothetical protein
MSIQGGSVTYGRTKNLGDYNSAKAEATISFDAADDLALAQGIALNAVAKLLGAPSPNSDAALTDEQVTAIAAKTVVKEPKKGKTKAEKHSEEQAAFQKAQSEEVPIGGATTTAPSSSVEIEEDFLTDKEVLPVISDKDISTQCNVVARKLGDNGGLRVRQLLAEVHGQPNVGLTGLTTPELRALFVKKLAELK